MPRTETLLNPKEKPQEENNMRVCCSWARRSAFSPSAWRAFPVKGHREVCQGGTVFKVLPKIPF